MCGQYCNRSKSGDNTPLVFITLNNSQIFFERVQEKFKIDSNLYRFRHHEYGMLCYDFIGAHYIVIDKDKKCCL